MFDACASNPAIYSAQAGFTFPEPLSAKCVPKRVAEFMVAYPRLNGRLIPVDWRLVSASVFTAEFAGTETRLLAGS
jgi:hypothetical protein